MTEQQKKPDPAADDSAGSDAATAADTADTAVADPVQTELQQLQTALQEAQAKAEENWNLYLNARADADNIRKRAERDLSNAHKFALEKFVNELLPVKDSFELGISAASETIDIDKIKEGSELTLKMFVAALEKFGVDEINPVGDKFNPEFHEAMAMQPAADTEPNTVLQVIQKGYQLNERLVRPALVIVAQAIPQASAD